MNGFYIGDIIGNSYTHENEKYNKKTKDFELFTNRSKFSDDTILSFATIKWLLSKDYTTNNMLKILKESYKKYPDKEPTIYGPAYANWAANGCLKPRRSHANGGAMRCSPIAWMAKSLKEIDFLVQKSISATHNTTEGRLGAKIVCYSIWYLKNGFSKEELKEKISQIFDIDLNENIEDYRNKYLYTANAIETVRPALISFLNSNSFEDAIRNAVSFGGDTDTITSICGAISEAYYKEIPSEILNKANSFLPEEFKILLNDFDNFIKLI